MSRRLLIIALLLFLPILAGPGHAAEEGAGEIDKAVVRLGEHPGFSRIVLDFARLRAYESHAQGNVLRLQFHEPVTVLLPPLAKDGLKNVATARWDADRRTLTIETVPGAQVRLWTSEKRKLVIDVYAPAFGGAARQNAAAAHEVRPASPPPSPGKDGEASGSSSPGPVAAMEEKHGDASASRAGRGAGMPVAATHESVENGRLATAMQPGAGPRLKIGYTRDPEGFALVLGLPPDIGFAAFRRGNLMWLALERPVLVDIDRDSPLAGEAGRLLSPFKRLDRRDATILYAEMRTPRDLSVSERGGRCMSI